MDASLGTAHFARQPAGWVSQPRSLQCYYASRLTVRGAIRPLPKDHSESNKGRVEVTGLR